MKRSAKYLVAGLLAAGIAAAILVAVRGSDPRMIPAPAVAAARSAPDARPARPAHAVRRADPEPAIEGHAFRAGDVLRYRVWQERTIALSAALPESGADAEGPQTAGLRALFSGDLVVRVRDADPDGWVMGFEVADVRAAVAPLEGDAWTEREDLPQAVSGEVLASMERSGRIRGLFFPDGLTVECRNIWRDLLAQWQIVLPDDADQTEWTAIEEDTTGEYVAHYVRQGEGEETAIEKAKTEYTRMSGEGGTDLARTAAVAGTIAIRLDPLPVRIEGDEMLVVEAEGVTRGANARTVFVFERTSYARDEGLAAAGGSMCRALHGAAGTTIGAAEQADGATLAAADEGDVEGALRALLAGLDGLDPKTPEAIDRMVRLVAILERFPQAAREVLAALADPSATDGEAALLLGALGAAGTEEAQRALEGIFTGADWTEARREGALIAFGQVESPIPDIDGSLISLYEDGGDLSGSSLLVLAAAGERVRERDPVRHEMIRDYVAANAGRLGLSPAERIVALDAIGNAGMERTPPVVEEAFLDPDPIVRCAAARALVRTFDATADELLIQAIRHDPSEEVRAAAADAAGRDEGALRGPAVEQALAEYVSASEAARERDADPPTVFPDPDRVAYHDSDPDDPGR
ncbi:MAG: HEAT repeat domain-containing protein [Planctomycetes bacterium]|nr:HEAT repeat domain-containing protein [Planctomycetota bacterium]